MTKNEELKLKRFIAKCTKKAMNEIIKDKRNLGKYLLHSKEPVNEMARIRQAATGLPMIVWLTPNDGTYTGKHNMPRLKFQDSHNTRLIASEMLPMSIHPANPTILLKGRTPQLPASDISKLKKWIVLNYNLLISYWNNEIFEDELIEGLKSV